MDKTKALLIAKMAHRECLKHKDCCQGCPFDTVIACGKGCAIDFITDKKLPEDIFQSAQEPFKPEQAKEPAYNLGTGIQSPFFASAGVAAMSNIPADCIGVYKGNQDAAHDSVNSPSHYCKGGLECIEAIRAAVSDLQGIEAVCAGNVIKYVWRYKGKNGIEDLKKAEHYLHWLIEEVEKNG